MVKKRDTEDYYISDTGHWNVAAEYSKFKIMRPLANCDIYENIAQFGYDTLQEELLNYGIPVDSLRIMGFKRLVKELLKIIKNTKFAMKKKGTEEEMVKYENQIKKIQKAIPTLSKTITKQDKSSWIKVNVEKFEKVLEMTLEIKSLMNTPLNKNDLIFTDKEEFDPAAYKKKIFDEATTRG